MRVYKYLSAEFAIRDLADHRIKISEFADMNDPFELLGVKLSEPTRYEGSSAAEIERVLRQHCQLSYGALCFSKSPSNPLLWSHYADKHRGICLGFDVAPGVRIGDPNYVQSQQEADSDVLIEGFPSSHLSEGEAAIDPKFQEAEQIIMRLLLTKFKDWEYEDELRLIARKKAREGEHYFCNFDAELKPCEVRIGVRCSEPRSRIEEAVKDYSEPIRIVKTRLDPENFQVVEDNAVDRAIV